MSRVVTGIAAALWRIRRPRASEIFRGLDEHQWWPAEQLRSHGEQLLRKLAARAAAHVPYYADLFRELRIDPSTMRFPEDWERIPVLTRELLRKNFDRMTSRDPRGKAARRMSSGGSTGEPVSFLVDDLEFDLADAFLRQAFTWCGWRPGEVCLSLWGGQGSSDPRTGLAARWRSRLAGGIGFPVYAFDDSSMAIWWQAIEVHRPSVVYAYASVAAEFSSFLLSRGLQPQGIKGVFCSAEPLLPEYREIIERTFGCKVYDQYGSRETPGVSCECPEGNLHIFSDLHRVEFLPSDGDGGERIVVTALCKRSMPLLRYDLGDLGHARAGQCACGRGYPLMELGAGRSGDFFATPSGRKIYPTFFVRLLYGKDWIRRFQFRQSTPDRVSLLLEPLQRDNVAPLAAALVSELEPKMRQLMGDAVRLETRIVESIPRTKVGKHRFVINEMEARREPR